MGRENVTKIRHNPIAPNRALVIISTEKSYITARRIVCSDFVHKRFEVAFAPFHGMIHPSPSVDAEDPLKRTVMRIVIPTFTGLATLMAGASAATAAEPPTPSGNAVLTLNDGTRVGMNDKVGFSFRGDRSAASEKLLSTQMMVCPEVNDPPVYDITGEPWFIPDTDKPQSTWLLPSQSVTWNISGSHTFGASITAGSEAEAGVVLAKAKVTLDASVNYSYTWNSSQEVTDTNDTSKEYRAVLGQVGWKLTGTKTWFAPPCKVKTSRIVVIAPHQGDMSIGRQYK